MADEGLIAPVHSSDPRITRFTHQVASLLNSLIVQGVIRRTGEFTCDLNAPVEIPAEEILSTLVTVDGADSGLDADLLDGNEASAFPTVPVTVANGGTGLTTLTSSNLLIGAGASNITFIAPGTSGNVLQSNGSVWASTTKVWVEVHPDAVNTTDATPTTLFTLALDDNTFYLIEVWIVGRRTGGGGAAGDGYVAIFLDAYERNGGGAPARVGGAAAPVADIERITPIFAGSSATTTVSSNNFIGQVTGVAGVKMTWESWYRYVKRT